MHNTNGGRYDAKLLADDIEAKGWLPIDLARKAKVSHMSVSRFLRGERQTPRMAKKFATALGFDISRYLIQSRQEASA